MIKQKSIDFKGTVRISEASKMLGVTPMTLRRWDEKGILKPIRLGTRLDRRYKKEDISRILSKQKYQRIEQIKLLLRSDIQVIDQSCNKDEIGFHIDGEKYIRYQSVDTDISNKEIASTINRSDKKSV
ncbi:hypothetical protein COW99_03775 [Candidatus Roizmanbacteria bacterium CG22_combo_CG10-13_8_21_14_all_38_20]|uniref:HTH merR-type domain-containing protein n=1 Tax=Candidatus Roizmanbacteria bacterium CG22_combo_CG10-13_8_21_14_all_38_20 TaxID=1974862 RepID=A0A2H0BWT2_9BACT|nr:MerR family transcriptional regulator [Candidatus Microgenomates bacterium]PIP61510.1 MAG: hypothetical protein COW99_03775 [Candidatus Roizmanbacteria bacterium CG22_combo_CG10-13_8_21_14_all_38_20]PJC32276.1 MAG: hypothetical protein CO050_00450 [Candidatus Roizmanbacteria bacterium CG_4_9_14_0_2_um_filter_38_17]